MSALSDTASLLLNAYGGEARWRSARRVTAVVSAKGFAFTMKRRPAFQRSQIICDVARPYLRLTPIGCAENVTGVLDGKDVRLEDANGNILEERPDARKYFPGGRRILWWDDLDMAYFAGYAFWNYLCLPALLLRSDVRWEELRPGILRGHFPDALPTHSPVQDFHVDQKTGQLTQHDYTANVIGAWAKAANAATKHDRQEGNVFISERRVTPRGPNARALSGPALIAITVHEFKILAN